MESFDLSLEDCLRREIKEEVGIEIDKIEYIDSDNDNGKIYIHFLAQYVSGDPKPLDGTAEVLWAKSDDLINKKFTPQTIELLKDSFDI